LIRHNHGVNSDPATLRAAALDSTQPAIEQLRAIVACLRAPEGCPWDREQTHASLRSALLEEAYEVVEAINNNDDANLREELGDLLLQSVFHAQIGAEEGRFDFDHVAREIAEKLIRRHPHVFGEDHCVDSDHVLKRWDEIKKAEKGGKVESAIDGIPGSFSPLLRAQKTQKKAAKIGFDWPSAIPVFDKIREELAEIEAELPGGDMARIEDEVGDLLFCVVNLARKLKLDAETALQGATEKFSRRFRAVEALALERQIDMTKLDLAGLDELWDEVKAKAALE
jgi:MazG family protein